MNRPTPTYLSIYKGERVGGVGGNHPHSPRRVFDPSAIAQIEEQIAAIRDIDPAGKLEDEHAYFLAFADALEAAIPDMESIIAGTPPADMTRIDAVTDAFNTLVPGNAGCV